MQDPSEQLKQARADHEGMELANSNASSSTMLQRSEQEDGAMRARFGLGQGLEARNAASQ